VGGYKVFFLTSVCFV